MSSLPEQLLIQASLGISSPTALEGFLEAARRHRRGHSWSRTGRWTYEPRLWGRDV